MIHEGQLIAGIDAGRASWTKPYGGGIRGGSEVSGNPLKNSRIILIISAFTVGQESSISSNHTCSQLLIHVGLSK